MENASKALLIAGEILIAILLITLLVYAFGKYQEYQTTQEQLAEIEDTTNFNNQFVNYDRKDVQGYELLTLINLVIDYNTRKTSADFANSNDKYEKITMTITINSADVNKFAYGDGDSKFFSGRQENYKQDEKTNALKRIIEDADKLERELGGTSQSATQIAKSYRSIFLTNDQITNEINKGSTEEAVKAEAVRKFNTLAKKNLSTNSAGFDSMKIQYEDKVLQYYEYMQFKRGEFECTKLDYDQVTGRVCQLDFKFTGHIR